MESHTSSPNSAAGPRTLRRGLLLLQTLQAHDDKGLSVTELSRLTELQRPTIYRLLTALIETGFVHSVGKTRRYAASSLQASPLAPTTQDANHLVKVAKPFMRALAEQVGDAVFLVGRDGNNSITLWREIGAYPIQILATYENKTQPMGVGAASMALMAKLDDAAVEEIIASNEARLEQYGNISVRELKQLIMNTRTRGYSVVGNYAVRGALGVGIALCDSRKRPLVGLSVTAITERMPARRQKEIAALLEQTGAQILKHL
ncbi:MAG TPA: helix-turn-helix domain-containing protein [Candidatus Paenalcaligenes intestinipullorum]|uniref:Helix-turn-helix domain-containing protein n=1 Tax=Candidatus Paenalcaligenes intestinipullorum TaxID=2838718 RepID=A0A9D2U6X1_9BURK|nr:helix-turn-helix domain-containing protein [Candidatus Paenalcaligenes intestinipullorum]